MDNATIERNVNDISVRMNQDKLNAFRIKYLSEVNGDILSLEIMKKELGCCKNEESCILKNKIESILDIAKAKKKKLENI